MKLRFLYTGGWRGQKSNMLDLPKVAMKKREENPDTFLQELGNFSRGPEVDDDAQIIQAVSLMNSAGYTAALPGEEDLRWGWENLARIAHMAQFPLLCSNTTISEDRDFPFHPFVITEAGKIKMAFLGVCGRSPRQDILLSDPFEALQYYIPMLHDEGAGLFIVLSNLDFESNRALITNVRGINAIISPYDGTQGEEVIFINNLPLARSPVNPYAMGSLTLTINE